MVKRISFYKSSAWIDNCASNYYETFCVLHPAFIFNLLVQIPRTHHISAVLRLCLLAQLAFGLFISLCVISFNKCCNPKYMPCFFFVTRPIQSQIAFPTAVEMCQILPVTCHSRCSQLGCFHLFPMCDRCVLFYM